MKVTVDARAAVNALGALRAEFETAVGKALDEAAAEAVRHAKATTLFNDRTGDLRGSIEPIDRVDDTSAFVQAGESAPYAAFLEYGTKFMDARPFMQQARDAAEPVYEAAAERHVEAAIHEYDG